MNKLPKNSSITLAVFHLPFLIALLVIAGLGTVSVTLSRKEPISDKIVSNTVLSDEDDRSEDEDNEDQEDNKDEKSGSDGKESDKEDSDNEQDKEDVKDETKTLNKNYVKTNVENDEDPEYTDEWESGDNEESKDTEEADDELDESEEKAEISSVTNADGTITKTFKKVDGDEVETKIVTYDVNGKKIDEQELNEDGSKDEEKTELVSSVTNPDGSITKTFKKTEDNEVELRSLTYNQNGVLIKKAELNPDGTIKEEEIIGEDDDENEEEEDNEFELVFKPSADGTVDPNLSRIIKAKLKQEIESEDKLGTAVSKLELEIKTSQGTIKYEGTALKDEMLFGLFGVEIPVDIEIDPITGKITAVNQSFWSKIIDFFSL